MPFWFGMTCLGGAGVQSGPLTIDQAVQVAVRNGYSVLISQTRVTRQQGVVAENQGNLGPKVNVGGTYTRFDREGTATFGNQTIVTSPIDTKGASLAVTLPIDINGALHHQVGAAKANLKAAEQNYVAATNDIKLNARNAFYGVLRAQKQVDVAQQSLKDAEDQLKNTELLEKGGAAAHVDTLRAQSQVEQSRSDLIAAQNALAIADATFNAVLARPIDLPVDLVEASDLPAQPTDEAKLRANAFDRRPEARALLNIRDALADVRRSAETGLMPTLNFSLNYSRSFNTEAFAQPYTLGGTFTIGWPLYDSGITKAKVKEACQDEEQVGSNMSRSSRRSPKIRQAMANLTNARQRLASATKQVQYTTENLRLAQVRYQAGEGILLQVTDAETLLTQARNQEVSARYDYLSAYAQLQHALGVDDIEAAKTATTPATKELKK